ncbi:MAG: DUF4271 domain-containing protein [Saprospiraceae bacterium]|nr:DUF4271 domain-containing protein [Saprospiraceae bacterium]
MSLDSKRFFPILLIICWFTVLSVSQSGNPFDIRKAQVSIDSQLLIKKDSSENIVINPFELRPGSKSSIAATPGQAKSQIMSWINKPANTRLQASEIQSLLFWALLFLSFLLAIALNINRSVTIKLYRSLINLNFLSLLYRESKEENLLIYYLLYGLYFIGASLFIYLSIIHFKGLKEPIYILYIASGVLLIYGIRHLSLKLLGMIYGIYKESDRYLFSIVIFSCIMAILLIPADFIITFVNPDIGRKCIWLICLIFVILYIYRQLREIIFAVNLWRGHIFHFLLYLCTFEIAPLVLMFVFLERQGVV